MLKGASCIKIYKMKLNDCHSKGLATMEATCTKPIPSHSWTQNVEIYQIDSFMQLQKLVSIHSHSFVSSICTKNNQLHRNS